MNNKKFHYEVSDFFPERSKFLYARPKNIGEATFIKEDFNTGFIWGFIDGCGTYLFVEKEITQERK
jgi:hypothetical protein